MTQIAPERPVWFLLYATSVIRELNEQTISEKYMNVCKIDIYGLKTLDGNQMEREDFQI